MRTIKQARARVTRERILREATRLFVARGYHDTSLDNVLKASGVTTGAFFHHFSGKEQLGFAVLDWYVDQRRRELAAIERTLRDADDPLERVFRLLEATRNRTQRRARRRQAGCVFGNLTTALAASWPTALTRWPSISSCGWTPPSKCIAPNESSIPWA
jgi:TetR/AcrR family transcriptional repressor of nem operon